MSNRRGRHQRKQKRFRPKNRTADGKERYAARLRKNMTPAELAVWTLLKRVQWEVDADFEPQKVVIGYIPDFVEEESKLIVEIDGPIHKYLKKRDARRQGHLEKEGYTVIRFPNSQVLSHTWRVVKEILRQVEVCRTRS